MHKLAAGIFGGLMVLSAIGMATADDKPTTPPEDNPCFPSAKFEDFLNKEGYHHFFDMTNAKDGVESIWIGGKHIVVTGQKDKDTTCFLAEMHDVIINSNTIEDIYKALDKKRISI